MNEYYYQYNIEDKTRKLDFANRHAWKYESVYKYRPLFSYRRLFRFLFKSKGLQKQVYTTCCNCC